MTGVKKSFRRLLLRYPALVLLAVLLIPRLAYAGDGTIRRVDRAAPQQYIVTLKPAAGLDVHALARQLARTYGGELLHVYERALSGFAIRIPEAAARRLSALPDVLTVEEDALGEITATQTNAPYNLDRLDTRPRVYDGAYNYNRTGDVASIYIFDTGVRTDHAEYYYRIYSGFSAFNDQYWVNDCHGHGTHVAGIAAGNTYGVAKAAALIPVRVCSCTGGCTASNIIAGVNWVISNHITGASEVANFSLRLSANTSLDAAINNLIDAGVVVVAGAGNDNQDACNYSPGRVPRVITVGGSDINDARGIWGAQASNTGSCVDIWAPGTNITSSWLTSTTATNTLSGTSMAAPHVAGMAAQYFDTNWGAAPATVSSALINNASVGYLTGIGSSPNRLLHIVP
ncbi:MAG TPA: S8 family peptidase [Thermoanaerobaculia bacterium]|nr:S8 family peptidase [Thermoanaerobaculia bacterium]